MRSRNQIERAYAEALAKHPNWPTDLARQIAIVMEEALEALQEANDLCERGESWSHELEIELAQLGAMVYRMLVNAPKE